MRVACFSDVHIEVRERMTRSGWVDRSGTDRSFSYGPRGTYPLDLGPDLTPLLGAVDLLVLAGDVGRIRVPLPFSDDGCRVTAGRYAEQAAAFLGVPVVLVPGNHEYYRGVFEDDREALLADDLEGVTVLDRGEASFPCGGKRLRVLGATLWTDYAAMGDPAFAMRFCEGRINDHRLIRRRAGGPFRPEDAAAEHRLSRAWLAERLAAPHDGPTIVVTHHLPHSELGHPQFERDSLGCAFYSDCDDLLDAAAEASVAGWIYGHHHWSEEKTFRGVRFLTAQPGYGNEETMFSGPGILEVPPSSPGHDADASSPQATDEARGRTT